MNTNSNVFLGLITGATLGTIAAMLYAPERGAVIRQRISETAEEAMDAISRAANELKGRTELALLEEKGNLESRLNALVAKSYTKPDELISLLERKLAELKKKNEPPQNAQAKPVQDKHVGTKMS